MATFGYQLLYGNGLNSNSQIRRSTDMIYQRGGTYTIILEGDTYVSSMEMDVDIYVDGVRKGRQQVVPNSIVAGGPGWEYTFNIRVYDYVSNFLESEHVKYYLKNDWLNTSNEINNKDYNNIVEVDIKYGYRYISGTTTVTEYTNLPDNEFDHYTDIPNCLSTTGFTASDFTNTGNNFHFVGGVFQQDEKFYYPNQDQELGTIIGTGVTINTVDTYRRLSPMSQFLMDYPSLPEKSETSRFLTEAPRIQTVGENENYILYYLGGQTGDRQVIEADFAVFTFYDINNTRLYTFEQDLYNDYPTGYTSNLNVRKVPCGPKEITELYNENVFGNSGLAQGQIVYYTVQLFGAYSYVTGRHEAFGGLVPVSEIFYFYTCFERESIKRCCGPESTRLSFLNPRGGYDYYTFTAFRNDTKKIDRKTYDNRHYSPSLNGPDHDFGRSSRVFNQEVTEEIVLETDYINVEKGEWLQGLFLSPQVYEVRETFISPLDSQEKLYLDLRPVEVISTDVETITKKHKKLNKYRITLKKSNTFFTNKGF